MVFSITQNPYSYSINPLISFAACSFSALKISHLFAKQVHLLNLSKEQAQRAKKIFLVVAQLSAAISVVYPTGSAVGFIALYIVSVAASRYFQNLTSSVAHIGEKEDPLVRFNTLNDLATSKPMLIFTAQTEKAKIINDHPEIPTLDYFASFEEMLQFAKTHEVSKLNLSNTRLNNDQIEMLTSQLPNLIHLNIYNCRLINGVFTSKIDDLNFKKITSRLTKLTDLDVGKNTALTSDALKTIASLEHLTHLNMSYTETDNPTFQLLATHLKKLTHLNISHCVNITSSEIQALMTNLKNLTYLDVSGCDLDDTNLQAIVTHLNKLTYLDLSYCSEMTSTGIQSLRALTNLSWLNLSDCKVDDTSLQIIATHLTNLTHLVLWGCKGVNDASLQAIVISLKKLIHLDISSCSEMTSTGIQSLSKLSNLSQLKLSFCPKVDDTSLQVIATHLKKLTHLNISYCTGVRSAGIQSLSALTNLSWLDLSHCLGVDDTSLQAITIHLKKLTHLNINYCTGFGPTGIQSLSVLSDLSWLNLSSCKVNDLSLQTIATHLKKLIHLDLSYGSELTSTGIQSLRALKNLSWLNLSDCKVDDTSLQIIAKHLKKLSYLNIRSRCNTVSNAGLKQFAGFKKIEIVHSIRQHSKQHFL